MSKIKVNSIEAATGSTITIPSGQTLDISATTLTLPSGVVTTTDTQTLTAKTLTAPIVDEINDANGNEEIIFSTTASAVNEITVKNSATTAAPEISATGDDTDIDLKLTPKGDGKLVLDGIKFPNADGSAGQALQTDGSGNLSFATPSGGKVLQVVTATDSTERTTTSTSFVTGSNTLSVTITPSSASNKIYVSANFSYGTPTGTVSFNTTLFRGATNLGQASNGFGNLFDGSSYEYSHATLQILDSPSTTSATTYQVYFKKGAGGGTGRINNNGAFSSITAFEIAG